MNNPGLLIVFSGPSGSGKDTLLKALCGKSRKISLSISATTRAPREGEVDGTDYYFITQQNFEQKIAENDMLEYAEYCGNYYGTPRTPIENWMRQGKDVILEIEVQGGAQVRKKCPDAVSIFILPPSIEELENRLRRRGTESEEAIQKRLAAARQEIGSAEQYDYVVVNDKLETAVRDIRRIIKSEKMKSKRNINLINEVLQHA